MAAISLAALKKRVERYPKKSLIYTPTPLHKVENLTRAMGGPNVYIKREDLTGLAFGGNKSRKLEFIIQDALDKKAGAVVTWAGLQSNWCLQTAAAAKKFGLEAVLLLLKKGDAPEAKDGNLLLDFIVGADVRIHDAPGAGVVKLEDIKPLIDQVESELKERGLTPYVAPIGGSMPGGDMDKPLGAIAYAGAFAEMMEQTDALGIKVDYVVHASGSGGTQAGLAAAAKAVSDNTKVLGISVSDARDTFGREVLEIARDTAASLDLDLAIEREDILVFDEYLQEGYGVVNRGVSEALRLAAVQEGIFFDPVYTGKALAAFWDLIKRGFFRRGDNVVFFHTGGTAALFPKRDDLGRYLNFQPVD